MLPKILLIYQVLVVGCVESLSSIPNKITVATSIREPFVVFDAQKVRIRGSEVTMLTEFGKKSNISIEFVKLDYSLIELLNAKEPFEKVIRNVNISKIDLFIGGLTETNVTQNHLVASRAYHFDSLTWCVKKFQPASAYKQIFYVVTDGWVYPFVTLLCSFSILVAYYFNQFEEFKKPYMELWLVGLATFTNTSPSYYPKNTSHRILFGFILLSGVICTTVSSTFLLKIVTHPFAAREIRSVDDILSNDLRLVGDRFSFSKLFQRTDRYPISKLKNFKIDEDGTLDIYLNQLSYDDNLAVIVSRQYALNKYLTEGTNIYCFKEPEIVHSYGLKVLMRKDFHFINELNNFMKNAAQGGLIKKWLAMEEQRLQYDPVNMIGQYDLQNVYGCLIIFAVLYILSIFCFIAELIIYKKVSQPNPSKFWIVAEILIDPERYFLHNHYEW